MQTYPDYVYRPNKRKNEKRRQARKNAVATFNSQDTTTTNNYEGGEAGILENSVKPSQIHKLLTPSPLIPSYKKHSQTTRHQLARHLDSS
ncbi:unnamed protein product [Rhizophagus irregularis]|uniref:Uncharacterized protein n=1 Tax=Rhizophagus irregularis TaxID=588596 RepID=A0A916EEC6_9GLOM|nr:hypothetical protein RIR_jg40065.t1 [Rhizophagus irregularis DAOM 181602=DAOM 197198]CAB5384440.1 unnamed protein product [Rhizophagus irregularis]